MTPLQVLDQIQEFVGTTRWEDDHHVDVVTVDSVYKEIESLRHFIIHNPEL